MKTQKSYKSNSENMTFTYHMMNTILHQDYGLKETTSMANHLLPKKYSKIFIRSIKMKQLQNKTVLS